MNQSSCLKSQKINYLIISHMIVGIAMIGLGFKITNHDYFSHTTPPYKPEMHFYGEFYLIQLKNHTRRINIEKQYV